MLKLHDKKKGDGVHITLRNMGVSDGPEALVAVCRKGGV